MGAIKRKADQGGAPARKERSAPQDRSAKRQRKSDAAENPPPATSKPDISTQNSIFKDEEKSFPRGGASVLTPLEHKQIQIKANQDVLFEQAGGKKRGGDDGMSDDDEDMGDDDEDAPTKSKKRRAKKNKNALGEDEEVHKIRAEGLTFKVYSARAIACQWLTCAEPRNRHPCARTSHRRYRTGHRSRSPQRSRGIRTHHCNF